MRIHTSSELRAIDQHAAAQLGIPTAWLMENAGRAVAHAARDLVRPGGRVVCVCGKGNNGGDGFVAARHLFAAGVPVAIWALAGVEEMKGDARANAEAARLCAIPTIGSLDALGPNDVVVDAVLGTGLTRAAEGVAADAIQAIGRARARGAKVVAVDVPSGLDADRPISPGIHVQADVTVTLHALKPALVEYPARGACGDIRVESIGLPSLHVPGPVRRLLTRADVATLLPKRAPDAHKGTAGHLLVVAGSPGKTGAARMACEAALRSGAGLVTLAAPAQVIDAVIPHLPEAMAFELPAITADGLLLALERKTALAIGPGIARTEVTGPLLVELLRHVDIPALFDADALNALAASREALDHLDRARVRPILTPHPAEMARLLGTTTEIVQRDRFASASEAAKRFNAHVILKGAFSVVAHPDGSLEVNPTGNPAMATAGMGDVLTGVGGALLAQRLDAADAVQIAVWAHGRAGDLAADGRARGLLATDVAKRLPDALAELA